MHTDHITTPRVDVYRQALMNLRLSLAGGHHFAALSMYERLAALAPHDPLWLQRKGDLLRRLGRPHEAARTYERALSIYGHRGPTTTGSAMAWLSHALVQGLDTVEEQELDDSDLMPAETGAIELGDADLMLEDETSAFDIDVSVLHEEPADTMVELDVSDIEVLYRR